MTCCHEYGAPRLRQLLTTLGLTPSSRAKLAMLPVFEMDDSSMFTPADYHNRVMNASTFVLSTSQIMETVNKTLSSRLKHARQTKEWTQSHLAAACGLAQSAIGNIEAGKRQAKGSLPQIAMALGISYQWLLSGKGEMTQLDPIGGVAFTKQAESLAVIFDALPNDQRIRARLYTQVVDILEGHGRQSENQPTSKPVPAPKVKT